MSPRKEEWISVKSDLTPVSRTDTSRASSAQFAGSRAISTMSSRIARILACASIAVLLTLKG